MKKLIFALVSSLLCLVLLCGSLLAESNFTLGATLGDSGTLGDSETLGDSGDVKDKISERIENAVKNGTDIDLISTGTVLTAEELIYIAESGRSVRLIGNGYIIELNSSDIPFDTGDCDFNISVTAVKETTVFNEIAVFKNSVAIKPVSAGDIRLSFKIFINRNYFEETGINDNGKLYCAEPNNEISENEIRYNVSDTKRFAEFKMNLASLYIIAERKPVPANDEEEVFDPAFGSDDEIETGDPGVMYDLEAEDFSDAEDGYWSDDDMALNEDEADNIMSSALKSSRNPRTGNVLSFIFPAVSMILGAAAMIIRRNKKF